MKEFNNIVLIGEYNSFYKSHIVIDGYSLDYSQTKEIRDKLHKTDFCEYGNLFQQLFPGKIVIYNCNGDYWYYKKGFKFDFQDIEAT